MAVVVGWLIILAVIGLTIWVAVASEMSWQDHILVISAVIALNLVVNIAIALINGG